MNADYRLFEFTSSKTLIIFTCSLNSTISTFPVEHMACQWSHAFWVINSEILTKKLLPLLTKTVTGRKQRKKKTTKSITKLFALDTYTKRTKFQNISNVIQSINFAVEHMIINIFEKLIEVQAPLFKNIEQFR